MISRRVEFCVDDARLSGVLATESDESKGLCILLHPHPLYGGDMDNHVIAALDAMLLGLGYSTLRFNQRGFAHTAASFRGVSGAVSDLLEVARQMKGKGGMQTVGLVGYSFGASVALCSAVRESWSFLVGLSPSMQLLSEACTPVSLAPVRCPVLLFHGSDDVIVPPSDSESIVSLMRHNRVRLVPMVGVDHFYGLGMSVVSQELTIFLRGLESEL
ncbi:MAG: hypothetical protein HXY34_13975 [Candidatus Thorarchaeota archaeon]|nr:hypothetical protein [Candidatus Thorarchaeota archaeon]